MESDSKILDDIEKKVERGELDKDGKTLSVHCMSSAGSKHIRINHNKNDQNAPFVIGVDFCKQAGNISKQDVNDIAMYILKKLNKAGR
jgi:hypothetical protein